MALNTQSRRENYSLTWYHILSVDMVASWPSRRYACQGLWGEGMMGFSHQGKQARSPDQAQARALLGDPPAASSAVPGSVCPRRSLFGLGGEGAARNVRGWSLGDEQSGHLPGWRGTASIWTGVLRERRGALGQLCGSG